MRWMPLGRGGLGCETPAVRRMVGGCGRRPRKRGKRTGPQASRGQPAGASWSPACRLARQDSRSGVLACIVQRGEHLSQCHHVVTIWMGLRVRVHAHASLVFLGTTMSRPTASSQVRWAKKSKRKKRPKRCAFRAPARARARLMGVLSSAAAPVAEHIRGVGLC